MASSMSLLFGTPLASLRWSSARFKSLLTDKEMRTRVVKSDCFLLTMVKTPFLSFIIQLISA